MKYLVGFLVCVSTQIWAINESEPMACTIQSDRGVQIHCKILDGPKQKYMFSNAVFFGSISAVPLVIYGILRGLMIKKCPHCALGGMHVGLNIGFFGGVFYSLITDLQEDKKIYVCWYGTDHHSQKLASESFEQR